MEKKITDKAKNSSNKNSSKKPNKTDKSDKKLKKSFFKKGGKDMNVYSSLSYKHRAKREAKARKNAEDLASLPKQPVKRFFAKLHPKRVFKFVFSKEFPVINITTRRIKTISRINPTN